MLASLTLTLNADKRKPASSRLRRKKKCQTHIVFWHNLFWINLGDNKFCEAMKAYQHYQQ